MTIKYVRAPISIERKSFFEKIKGRMSTRDIVTKNKWSGDDSYRGFAIYDRTVAGFLCAWSKGISYGSDDNRREITQSDMLEVITVARKIDAKTKANYQKDHAIVIYIFGALLPQLEELLVEEGIQPATLNEPVKKKTEVLVEDEPRLSDEKPVGDHRRRKDAKRRERAKNGHGHSKQGTDSRQVGGRGGRR